MVTATRRVPNDLAEAIRWGELDDYRPRPPRPRLVDGGSIDAKVCARATCSNCGHRGLTYRPFVREEPYSYRAFAVCPRCGASEEF